MTKQADDQHKFDKIKHGFKVETTDPVQDIMSDEELKQAENKIFKLIEDDELPGDKSDNYRN